MRRISLAPQPQQRRSRARSAGYERAAQASETAKTAATSSATRSAETASSPSLAFSKLRAWLGWRRSSADSLVAPRFVFKWSCSRYLPVAWPSVGWNGRLARCFRRLAGNTSLRGSAAAAKRALDQPGADAPEGWRASARKGRGGPPRPTGQRPVPPNTLALVRNKSGYYGFEPVSGLPINSPDSTARIPPACEPAQPGTWEGTAPSVPGERLVSRTADRYTGCRSPASIE